MQKRRRFKQTHTLDERLAEQAAKLREQADHATTVANRDRLIRMARHAETAAHMNEWLTSPGLRPPT